MTLARMIAVGVALGSLATTCAKQEGPPYRLATKTSASSAETANLVLEIEATPPFKWNEKFPFRLEVVESQGAQPKVRRLGSKDVRLSDDKRKALIQVPLENPPRRDFVVEAKASFSVCTKDSCRIFRDVRIAWKGKDS